MRRTCIFLGIIAVVLLLSSYGIYKFRASGGPIPSQGGAKLQITLPIPSHFLQQDARWAAEEIGGSSEKIAHVGCTLCSLAIALNGLGEHTNPKELNALLKKHDGYTSRGWLVWEAIDKVFPGLTVDVLSRPTLNKIDLSLKNRNYPVVKYFLPGGIPHWVVIVGKSGTEYLILDPLNGSGRTILSQLTADIYSVRLVRRR